MRLVRQAASEMVTCGGSLNQALGVMHLDPVDGGDLPLFLRGRTTALVGVPGQPDCVILTQQGAVSGQVQDAAAMDTAVAEQQQAKAPQPALQLKPTAEPLQAQESQQQRKPQTNL